MCANEQKTILLVEDSATYALAEAARARGFGYKVITASSGEEAVDLATRNETIDLILMDIELGEGIDGTEAAKRILAERHIPIIFHTAHTEKEYIDKLKAITRYGVVAKNSGEFILQSSIEMALELFEVRRCIEIEIAESKKAENLLFASEYKYRTVVELAADAVFLADAASGAIIDCNKKAEKLLGKTRGEIIGINQTELHPPDKAENYKKIFQDHIKSGRDITDDVVVIHKDGHHIPVDIHATVFELDGRNVVLGLFRDITERKKQEDELKRTKKRYDLATSIGKVGIWSWNPATGNVVWNDETFRVLGLEPGAVQPSYELFLNMLLPEDRELLSSTAQKALQEKKQFSMDCRVITEKGEVRICHTTGEVEFNDAGESVRMVGTFQDITGRKIVENALKQSHQRLLTVLNELEAIVYIADIETHEILFANKYTTDALGDVEGKICWKAIQAGQTGPCEFCTNSRLIDTDGKLLGIYEWEFQNTKTGRWYHIRDKAIEWIDGRIVRFEIATDITNRKHNEEKIYNLAFYDALTQLPNRRLLNDRIKQAMATSKRSGLYCALLFMDLDNFKSLNDTQGHVAGDLLLTDAASRILNCVREVDTVARFGGDEFVVMLSEMDVDKAESIKQTTVVAEKIRNIIAKPYVLTLQQESKANIITIEHHCTASIGAVMFLGHGSSVEDIIKWADIAMYKAKAGGGNQVYFYE